MVKECMVILTNMTEHQSRILSKSLNVSNLDTSNENDVFESDIHATEHIVKDDNLSQCGVVNIDGIMLPLYDKNNVVHSNLVPVKSTVNNLRSLALAVASGL